MTSIMPTDLERDTIGWGRSKVPGGATTVHGRSLSEGMEDRNGSSPAFGVYQSSSGSASVSESRETMRFGGIDLCVDRAASQ